MNGSGSISLDATVGISKVAPTLTVSAISAAGVGLQDWVYILTIVYTVLQIGYFIWKITKKKDK